MIIVFMFGAKEELVDFSGPDLSWEATGVRQDLVNCDMIKLWDDIPTYREQKASCSCHWVMTDAFHGYLEC